MKQVLWLVIVIVMALLGWHEAAVMRAKAAESATLSTSQAAPHNAVPTIPVVFSAKARSPIPEEQVPLLEQIDRENTKVIAFALPTVVRISATRPTDPHMQMFGRQLPFQFPFGGRGPSMSSMDTYYGSGVIIGKDGYIVTNNHVIEDARELEVQLGDKRTFPAHLVGTDEPTDIAVLKIEAKDLNALPWGDSDKAMVGQQVFAIGDPFDLSNSVSKGIVSATGRSLQPTNGPDIYRLSSPYDNFIQTDAAINRGNSGGALVNIHGELIGINSAIASTTGGNMGVGFAIPSNLARLTVEGLLKNGHMVRGYLGVMPRNVDEDVAKHFGLGENPGALVAGVAPNSPADKAGLLSFDIISSIDGHKTDSTSQLRLIVAQIPIGKEVKVEFLRDGKQESKMVMIAEMPKAPVSSTREDDDSGISALTDPKPAAGPNVLEGLQVTDLSDETRKKFSVDGSVTKGVVVSEVQEGSLPDAKGLMKGDVIESASVNRGSTLQLISAKNFSDLAQDLTPGQSIVLLVHHRTGSSFVYLAPGK
jgi:serine protease Do